MNKPFEIADLAMKLKEDVPQDVEAQALKKVNALFAWIEESIAIHPSPIVKGIGAMFIQYVKPEIYAAVDKIDGKVG
jgi:hypothetical protein